MFGFSVLLHIFLPIWSLFSLVVFTFQSFIRHKNISIKDEKNCKIIFWLVWSIGLFAFGTTVFAMLKIDIPSISYLHSEWGVAPDPNYNFLLSLIIFGVIALLIFSVLSLISTVSLGFTDTEPRSTKTRIYLRLYLANIISFTAYYIVSTLISI